MIIGASACVLNWFVLADLGLCWVKARDTALADLVAIVGGDLDAADIRWRLGRALEVLQEEARVDIDVLGWTRLAACSKLCSDRTAISYKG
jgi:hypothetical protein